MKKLFSKAYEETQMEIKKDKDNNHFKFDTRMIGKTKNQRNKILNSISFTLLTTLVCTVLLYNISVVITNLNGSFLNEQNSMESTFILYTKKYLDAESNGQLKEMSHKIVETINKELDMKELQKSLNQGIVPEELEEIFKENIMGVCTIPGMDANTNDIFICNSSGILAEYSKAYVRDDDITRTWEVEKSSHANQDLFAHTVDQMIKQDIRDMLVEERVVDDEGIHSVLKKMNEKDLARIYSTEGLEGIRNYTFLVPVYVLSNTDIFGVPDILNGKKIYNNKFIIVQRYNLYDYIKMYHLDAQVNTSIKGQFKNLSVMFNLFIIVYIIITLINVIYSINILNSAIADQEKDYTEAIKELAIMGKNKGSASPESYPSNPDCKERRMNFGRRASDKYVAEILAMAQEERKRMEEEDNK